MINIFFDWTQTTITINFFTRYCIINWIMNVISSNPSFKAENLKLSTLLQKSNSNGLNRCMRCSF